MNSKIQMLTIGLLGLFLGAMAGMYVAGGDSPEPQRPTISDRTEPDTKTEIKPDDSTRPAYQVSQEDFDYLRQRHVDATAEALKNKAEADELRDERDRLAAELAEAESEREALKAEVTKLREATPRPERGELAIDFGPWSKIDEIADADWAELGEAAGKMTPILVELADIMRRGEQPPASLMTELQRHNDKLAGQHYLLRRKLPTHASVNGEFTHPINLANMLEAQMTKADMPLTAAQVAAIKRHGQEYDRLWNALQAGYTDATFVLEKLLDEAQLKLVFKNNMMSELTADQRALADPESIRDIVGLDLYSPALLFSAGVFPAVGAEQADLIQTLKMRTGSSFGMSSDRLDAAEHLFTQWLLANPPKVVDAGDNLIHLDEILRAGHGQLALMKELHAVYAENDEQRAAIKAGTTVMLPRLHRS